MLAVSGGWEAEMGYLKIVVKIPDTIYPELVADLQRVQLRDRAERVRVLAMLGLRTLEPMQRVHLDNNSDRDSSCQEQRQEQQLTAKRMIRSLTESL